MFAYLADRPYAADAEGLYLRELTGVEDKAMALGGVIKPFKFIGRVCRGVEGDDGGAWIAGGKNGTKPSAATPRSMASLVRKLVVKGPRVRKMASRCKGMRGFSGVQ